MKKNKKTKHNLKSKNSFNWNKRQLTREILKVFSENSKLILNYRQVSKKLNIKGEALKQRIQQTMIELAQLEQLKEISRGRFIYTTKETYIIGSVD